MPAEFSRAERIAAHVHRTLSQLLSREVRDPRVEMVTIGDVEVSADLSVAKVYFSLPEDADSATVLEGLNRARGFLRSRLADTLSTRRTPQLQFYHDTTLERGDRLEALIEQARQRDQNL